MKNLSILFALLFLSFLSVGGVRLMKPSEFLTIYGTIEFDSLTDISSKVFLELTDRDTKLTYSTSTDSVGYFEFKLPTKIGQREFDLTIKSIGFLDVNHLVILPIGLFEVNLNDLVDLKMRKEEGIICSISVNSIYYQSGSYSLDSVARKELDRLLFILKENPDLFIEIGSHSDCIGSDKANLELSKKRSETVYQYLVKENIIPERLEIFYFGESKPVNECDCYKVFICSEEELSENRRTEFRISSKTKTNTLNGF